MADQQLQNGNQESCAKAEKDPAGQSLSQLTKPPLPSVEEVQKSRQTLTEIKSLQDIDRAFIPATLPEECREGIRKELERHNLYDFCEGLFNSLRDNLTLCISREKLPLDSSPSASQSTLFEEKIEILVKEHQARILLVDCVIRIVDYSNGEDAEPNLRFDGHIMQYVDAFTPYLKSTPQAQQSQTDRANQPSESRPASRSSDAILDSSRTDGMLNCEFRYRGDF